MSDDLDENGRRDRGFTIEVVLAGTIVFCVAIAVAVGLDAEPGSVADWVAALSTLAAFVAAVIAARYAAQAVDRERRRDQRWLDEARQAQASQIAVWFTVNPMYTTGNAMRWRSTGREVADHTGVVRVAHDPHDGGLIPEPFALNVRNASNVPIYQLRLHVHLLRAGEDPSSPAPLIGTFGVGHALPGDTAHSIESPYIANRLFDATAGTTDIIAGVSFVLAWSFLDHSGHHWIAEPWSGLRRVNRDDLPKADDWYNPADHPLAPRDL